MATLYVRNVPDAIYRELRQWAAQSDRSVNTLVLDLLERELSRRDQHTDFHRRLEAMKAKYPPITGPPWPEDLIREDRDRGHKPEFGY